MLSLRLFTERRRAIFNRKLDDIVREFEQNYYESDEIFFTKQDWHFPNRRAIIEVLDDIRRIMFPRYFGKEVPCETGPKYFIGDTLTRIEHRLRKQVHQALLFRDPILTPEEVDRQTSEICSDFFYQLPRIQRLLLKDVQAAFDGDPSAQSKEEVIFSFPGFYATFVQRVAHELYLLDVPLIPRIMSEHAHSETGADIHAGARIGEYFFIDHATGVVIGETSVIGDHVKIYQGVTLGALSLRGGQGLKGIKRHPTIGDNVTIYSGASVLGGDTVIGENSIIAGNTFVIESVPANSRVFVKEQDVIVRESSRL